MAAEDCAWQKYFIVVCKHSSGGRCLQMRNYQRANHWRCKWMPDSFSGHPSHCLIGLKWTNTVVRPCFHWELFCNCFPNIVCDSLTLQPTSERPLIGIMLREIPATRVGPVFLPFLLESSWGKFLHVRGGSNVFVHCWCWGGGIGEGEY